MSQFLELSKFDVKLKKVSPYTINQFLIFHNQGNHFNIELDSDDLVKLRDFLMENVK